MCHTPQAASIYVKQNRTLTSSSSLRLCCTDLNMRIQQLCYVYAAAAAAAVQNKSSVRSESNHVRSTYSNTNAAIWTITPSHLGYRLFDALADGQGRWSLPVRGRSQCLRSGGCDRNTCLLAPKQRARERDREANSKCGFCAVWSKSTGSLHTGAGVRFWKRI